MNGRVPITSGVTVRGTVGDTPHESMAEELRSARAAATKRISELEAENADLKRRLHRLKRRASA